MNFAVFRLEGELLSGREKHRHPLTRVIDDDRSIAGSEVAVLVEHVVGRQQALAGGGGDRAAVAERGGIEERAAAAGEVGLHGPDQGRYVADLPRDRGERFRHIRHEAALEQ